MHFSWPGNWGGDISRGRTDTTPHWRAVSAKSGECLCRIPGSHRQTVSVTLTVTLTVTVTTPVHWDFWEDSFSKCHSTPKPLFTLPKNLTGSEQEGTTCRPLPLGTESQRNPVEFPYQLSSHSPKRSAARLPGFPCCFSCVIWGKLAKLSVSQFSHLQNGAKIPPTSQGCLRIKSAIESKALKIVLASQNTLS